MASANPVQCTQCAHYIVTWDKHRPYGCKKLKFKSAAPPSLVVYQASGHPCLAFEPKPRHHSRNDATASP